jgi:polysaccharide export outer membrane protein
VRSASVIVLCALSAACADVGKFVWVSDYPRPAPASHGFVISAGDMLLVRVYNQDQLTTRARVRADGRVTLPLLNDVEAASYSPTTLGQQLETRYKEFLKLPVVTVAVEEVQPLTVPAGGEVVKQGVVTVERGAGVLQVLLASGGLTDYAHRDRIFVLRHGAQPQRIRFTWEALTRGEEHAAAFALQPGDSVVVE